MNNPPIRSPKVRVAKLSHFGRMLDKIRLHHSGALPDEYRANFGLRFGLDGHLCGFLGVDFSDLCARVQDGGSDEEIAEWCFTRGLRPNRIQAHIWNEFARKFGWNDMASDFLTQVIAEEGIACSFDILTAFDLMDFREGRLPKDKQTT
ncbi:MAG TPA: DUF5069 domain-containing protein [Terrimicrobiaceae bacterium]